VFPNLRESPRETGFSPCYLSNPDDLGLVQLVTTFILGGRSIVLMELRSHPKMTWGGRPNWPPHWNGPYGPNNPLPEDEAGILVKVETGAVKVVPHCFLIMRHKYQDYYGSMFFDDGIFLIQLLPILREYIGSPIAKIGSLDIP
jgi:hypothetical protein